MNKAFLLGGLFLRVTSVYAAATHGDLIVEGRRRNEKAYEQTLEETGWKKALVGRDEKMSTSHDSQKSAESSRAKNN